MQPVMSEEESDQYLAVLTFPRCVLVMMYTHAQVPNHVCIYVCVRVSVAVYKTHVELQIEIHTLCIYVHTDIRKGLVQFLQSTVPIFSKNAKENIFNIYTWNRF